MWTTVVLASLLSTGAEAKEYQLDPRVSSISLDDQLKFVPKWIDVTNPDYVISVDLQNNGQDWLLIRSSTLRCVRGSYEGPATYGASFGMGERSIDIAPGQVKTLKLLCDHGPDAEGDFGLKIGAVTKCDPEAHAGDLVFQNVTWRLAEPDVAKDRQAAGKQLATGSYDRAPREEVVVVVPVAVPVAVPALPPPPQAAVVTIPLEE